ncbi:MAG: glycosyltransferase family 4 protein [Deltaproteobacteria bacterium]|nr:glycosyltransferase family 4 protein [Deltaproteobacteria bacterium]MBI3391442.1 glycosyltransferase family 4 protein [Deltaproteobacteria bacterium]
MRILIALTYYRPHVSGLTIYAQRLAQGLAQRGHTVTVLTSRFNPTLPVREREMDGVEIVRVPVAASVSKGVIMPLFPFYAATFIRRHDVVNAHMPQFEAALLAGLGRTMRRGVVLTYQCDLSMPPGWLNRVVETSLAPLNEAAARLAHSIVVTTADYAEHSPFLTRHQAKLAVIPTLINTPVPEPARSEQLARRWGLEGAVTIGFAARFAAEKGVEYLLEALPRVAREVPNVRIAFTGAYKYTVGEQAYLKHLEPLIAAQRERLVFLDLLSDDEMANFFSVCDVLAVTSLNSTESFGLVQVESMLCGTPVVATDLPGVREAVRRTGMGLIVAPRDPAALADALVRVIRERAQFQRPRAAIIAEFNLDAALEQYEQVFAQSRLSA